MLELNCKRFSLRRSEDELKKTKVTAYNELTGQQITIGNEAFARAEE